jgi:hypothetical protein
VRKVGESQLLAKTWKGDSRKSAAGVGGGVTAGPDTNISTLLFIKAGMARGGGD